MMYMGGELEGKFVYTLMQSGSESMKSVQI
jgi:hypothetical protein